MRCTDVERRRERIREELNEVIDPCSAAAGTELGIVEMGLVDSIEIDGGSVTVRMRLTTPVCTMVPYFIEEVESRVGSLDWVTDVSLDTDTGLWEPSMMGDEALERRKEQSRELVRQYGPPDRDRPPAAKRSD